jgi:predicted nucleic acid-binding protein
MLDANILYSAIINPTEQFNAVIWRASRRNTLVLCDQIVEELFDVIQRRAPRKLEKAKEKLGEMNYEPNRMPEESFTRLAHIRDETDYPILHVAITKNVDVLVTGDEDFSGIGLKKPKIVKADEFVRDSRYKGKWQKGR